MLFSTGSSSSTLKEDQPGSLLTLAEFLHYPSCTLQDHATDDGIVSTGNSSNTKQNTADFNMIQVTEGDLYGLQDVTNLKDTENNMNLIEEVIPESGNSCSCWAMSEDNSPVSKKFPAVDYISLQMEQIYGSDL